MILSGKRTVQILLVAGLAGGIFLFAGLWVVFHQIPTERDLRSLIEKADAIEVFRFQLLPSPEAKEESQVMGVPTRWFRTEDSKDWEGLAESLQFQKGFWKFSKAPTDSVVLQVFVDDQRHAWEVRDDGAIHIRKAVRWYQMPVGPGFEKRLRRMLEERGEDLDPKEQLKRFRHSFTPKSST